MLKAVICLSFLELGRVLVGVVLLRNVMHIFLWTFMPWRVKHQRYTVIAMCVSIIL